MKKDSYEKLRPFLHRKSARQKLIIFLIGDGYTVVDLVAMDVKTLRSLELPVEMEVIRDEALDGRWTGLAFIYPSGKPIPHTGYYRLIRMASEKAIGRPMSQESFRAYLK